MTRKARKETGCSYHLPDLNKFKKMRYQLKLKRTVIKSFLMAYGSLRCLEGKLSFPLETEEKTFFSRKHVHVKAHLSHVGLGETCTCAFSILVP